MADEFGQAMAQQLLAVRTFYEDELTQEFRNLGNWRSSNIDTWTSRAVPIVMEAQNVAADIADSFTDLQIQELLGDFNTAAIDKSKVTGPAVRNGVPPSEVYARAFKPVWQGLGNGLSLQDSIESGVARLESMFELDISRVADHVAIERFANENRIVGYRRVLTGVRNCALCIVASTQLYHKSHLKDIHPRCKCTTSPVLSFENPNHILDGDLLEQVHKGIQDQFGISARDARQIDYRKILVTRRHGEYGNSLTYARYQFTGPKALKTPGE